MSDRERIAEIANKHLPADVAARWLGLLRPAAALRHAQPGEEVAAALGGLPNLPDAVNWPTWGHHGPLSFVAAIDCGALTNVPLDIRLPRAGSLLFFYSDGRYHDDAATVGFWDPDTLADGARVLHVPAGETVSLRPSPAGLAPYERMELSVTPIVTFPGFEHPDLQSAFAAPGEDLRSFLDHPVNGSAFLNALSAHPPGPRHQVGGYATPVQGPVEHEAALAELGGRDPGDKQLLAAEQARWTLLTQIDSDDRAGMMWGDLGTLYWLSRRDDMSDSRLGQTSFTWQCS